MELGADRGQHVAAVRRVGEADRGVAGLDGAGVALAARGRAGRPARGRCAPSGRPAAGCRARAAERETGRRPGWPHSRSERERSGVIRSASLICVAAELEELRLGDVLERDVEAVDPRHRLARWRCGGRASSSRPAAGSRRGASGPGRRPTTVQTPSPSTTKRNAFWVWRCSGASSPGIRYWIAAHSVGVANGRPPRPGLASAIARRSPPRPTGHEVAGAVGELAAALSQRHRCGDGPRSRGAPASGRRSRSTAGRAAPARSRGRASSSSGVTVGLVGGVHRRQSHRGRGRVLGRRGHGSSVSAVPPRRR